MDRLYIEIVAYWDNWSSLPAYRIGRVRKTKPKNGDGFWQKVSIPMPKKHLIAEEKS
jgi:hypothetical protein